MPPMPLRPAETVPFASFGTGVTRALALAGLLSLVGCGRGRAVGEGDAETGETEGGDEEGELPDACADPDFGSLFVSISGTFELEDAMWSGDCGVKTVYTDTAADRLGAEFGCLSTAGSLDVISFEVSANGLSLSSYLESEARVSIDWARWNGTRGEENWFVLRTEDGRLLASFVQAQYLSPVLLGTGSDFFIEPFGLEPIGGVCEQGEGQCFERGEPAVLRFFIGDEVATLLPRRGAARRGFEIRTGDSWLSDPNSVGLCDGSHDDWFDFAITSID